LIFSGLPAAPDGARTADCGSALLQHCIAAVPVMLESTLQRPKGLENGPISRAAAGTFPRAHTIA